MNTIAKVTMTAFMIAVFTGGASAQNNTPLKDSKTTPPTTAFTRGQFVDNNKNGVCDNFEARGQSGRGANFVDKNGDGICDNRGTMSRGNRRGNGCGQGYQHRHGQGNGQGNCFSRVRGFDKGAGNNE